MNKIICAEKKCTGCYACANICPKQCIEMRPKGVLGHVYPHIDISSCINCKLCERVCQVNSPIKLAQPIKAYAGKHREESAYVSSTSGGATDALSCFFLQKGGIVYGCVESSGVKVYHKRIDSLEDVKLIKGSKYAQSDIDKAYVLVKDDLISGKEVLFFGTPCQVAGLKSFLRKDYDNLYTVDLICHGTPSQEFLRNYVKKKTKNLGVYVSFRKGNDYLMQIFDNSSKELYKYNLWKSRYKDLYFNTFIDGYTSRDSCVHCNYASPNRCSDITIGDFWGLSDDLKEEFKNGCSCILPITEKGDNLISSINMILYNRSVDEAIKGNDRLRAPKTNKRRCLFDAIAPYMGVHLAYIICEFDHIFNYRIWRPSKRLLRTQIRNIFHI